MFKLTFHRGSLSGETLKISTPQVVLGRSREDCEVWLDDDGVSRQHCRIEKRDDGIYIVDLDSRNGTWVNREQITERRLETGDTVHLGSGVKLTFDVVMAEAADPVQPAIPFGSRVAALLSGILAFLRTTVGGVFVGLSIGTTIALLLFFFLPHPREQAAETMDVENRTYLRRPILSRATRIFRFHRAKIPRCRDRRQSHQNHRRKNQPLRRMSTTPTRRKPKMRPQLTEKIPRRP